MRFEIIVFLLAGLIAANIYTDGKLLKTALSWKKYYQMIGVGLGALFFCWLLRRNPANAHQLIASSNEYLKYLPIDRTTSSVLSPILDFTSKYNGGAASDGGVSESYPILNLGSNNGKQEYAEKRILSSGLPVDKSRATKRSVSETKKKWVAAKQSWRCGHCGKQLPPWFEVDHKIRLEHGGSNHVDNLVALCRDCHGEKTAIENL